MSTRKDIARKSVVIILLDQIVTYFISFISRKVFLITIGVSYLGLNSTLTQMLGALTVSELGIQSVIIYKLYKPMVDGDRRQVCQVMSLIRYLYHWVAWFILGGSLVLMPFLPYFIHDVEISSNVIYAAWIMMAVTTALSYTLNYNSVVIFADQKQYIYQGFHLVANTVITGVNLLLLYILQNYLLYLAVGMANTLINNVILLYLRRKFYPWIKKVDIPSKMMKEVKNSTIDIFAGRIAGYVLNSTGYIVISALISTTLVGYISNYMTVFIAVTFLICSICGPIQQLVGNMLASNDGRDMVLFVKRLNYAIYIVSYALVLLSLLLVDDFVSLFYGEEYIINKTWLYLMIADVYVAHNQSGVGLLLDAAGEFRVERQFYIKSAVLTLLISLGGGMILGVSGVLVGVLVGRIYLWCCRGYYSHKCIIDDSFDAVKMYFYYQFKLLILFIVSYFGITVILERLFNNVSVELLFIKGMVVILVTIIVQFVVYGKTDEFKYLLDFVYNYRRYK